MYFERIDPQNRCYRFYQITVDRSLFGSLILTRTWGRIGSKNARMMRHEFSDVDALLSLVREIVQTREKHHYQAIHTELKIPGTSKLDRAQKTDVST